MSDEHIFAVKEGRLFSCTCDDHREQKKCVGYDNDGRTYCSYCYEDAEETDADVYCQHPRAAELVAKYGEYDWSSEEFPLEDEEYEEEEEEE